MADDFNKLDGANVPILDTSDFTKGLGLGLPAPIPPAPATVVDQIMNNQPAPSPPQAAQTSNSAKE